MNRINNSETSNFVLRRHQNKDVTRWISGRDDALEIFFSHDIADGYFHKFMLHGNRFRHWLQLFHPEKPAERNIVSSTGCSLCPCINIENTNRSELLTSLLSFARRAIYPLMVMLPSSCALAQRECYLSAHGAVTIDFHPFSSCLASIISRNVNPRQKISLVI